MEARIEFRLNGHPMTLKTDPRRLLLWVLRTDLELTGTKYGCGAGICGACTVLIDGRSVRACLTALQDVHGHDLLTVEGLLPDPERSTRCSRRLWITARCNAAIALPG
jgi:isoquinoline 1-oxidoreductase alpha subunit